MLHNSSYISHNMFLLSLTPYFLWLPLKIHLLVLGESVTGPTRREVCGSICKVLLDSGMVITGLVQTVANRYIEDKTEEYSSQQAWSSIGEQYQRA